MNSTTTTLEKSAREAKPSTVKAIPEGMHSVTPHLICADASAAIDFYKEAFGAVETTRLTSPQGGLIHAAIRIGDSTIMLAEECLERGFPGPKALKGSPVTVHLYVEDADATVACAAAAGAKITMPVMEMFWGDRYGRVEDPYGHHWSIATHVREVSAEGMQKAAAEMCGAADGEGC